MRPKLRPLAEQVMLITGASSGIGLVTAKAAARAGAKVMLVARNAEALQGAVDEIVADGGEATFAIADVGSAEEVQDAAAQAVARFGRIDTWVNDAGVAIYAKLIDTPLAEHQRMFRTNYFGVVNGCTTAVEHLREHGGALITVGSIAAQLPSPILGAYSATKHATKGYVDSLRIELAADGLPIQVTLIKPSGIDTPIGQHAANHLEGEALVPPPAYDPLLVAKAILDAAVTPRRELTVGGAGQLQILLATHFPQLLDRFGGWMIPLLHDTTRRKTQGNSLYAPGRDGDERSGLGTTRRTSLYTAANRHKAAIGLSLGLIGVAGALALRRAKRA